MVVIKEVSAKEILDANKNKTISVSVKTTDNKKFRASAPNGKSKGKHEAKPYKKSIEDDIKKLNQFSDYFSKEIIEEFRDLKRIEDICEGHIGANSLFALESAILKALADEQKKEVWQVINQNQKKSPRLVGNCIGGAKHSIELNGRKPDFQEFLLIPDKKSVKENFELNKKTKEKLELSLKEKDSNFNGKKNDENAWTTSLNEKEILEILDKLKIPLGIDVASSSFYKRKKYLYQNPLLKRDSEEQLNYISNLIKNYNLFYIEDPFDEEDFESHAKLVKKFPNSLIVGDDLIVTNYKRLKKAVEQKAVSAIIVKPNQCGSLIEVERVCKFAKENNVKLVFSHRSSETKEEILADLAFGFGADFFKCGITGKEREIKMKRLIEIEKGLK